MGALRMESIKASMQDAGNSFAKPKTTGFFHEDWRLSLRGSEQQGEEARR